VNFESDLQGVRRYLCVYGTIEIGTYLCDLTSYIYT
jgi:hypothetical protein